MTRSLDRVLILGNYCSANKGDAAILSGLVELLRKEYPEVSICVSSFFPEIVEQIHGLPAIPPLLATERGYDPKAYKSLRKWSLRFASKTWSFLAALKLGKPAARSLRILAESDLVIGVGGTYYNDNYRPAIVGRLHELQLAKAYGKPVLLLGHSIGPFNLDEYSSLAGDVLKRIDEIGVRDEISRKLLTRLGVPDHIIEMTGDTAYFAPVASKQEAEQLAAKEVPFFGKSPLVSVSVRRWDCYQSGKDDAHDEYVSKMASVCDHLIENHHASVVFLSTCTSFGGYWADDRKVAGEVLTRMKQSSQARILETEFTVAQLAGLFGLMDLHVGTRLHSVILATMAGTPSVAIAYEFKSSEFMEQMGLSEYVVDIDDFTVDELDKRIDRAMSNLPEIKNLVKSGIELAKNSAGKNLELIRRALTD